MLFSAHQFLYILFIKCYVDMLINGVGGVHDDDGGGVLVGFSFDIIKGTFRSA